MRKHLIPFAQV